MKHKNITLAPLTTEDREQFILDNQWAFKYGALHEFGARDNHLDADGEIISRKTIESCLDAAGGEAYRILADGQAAGGVILSIDPATGHNHLEILFTAPELHGKGIGFGAWQAVEALHPETTVWETFTPYFEKRNICFYVNKCGFHIVEFCIAAGDSEEGPDEMFRLQKVMDTSTTLSSD